MLFTLDEVEEIDAFFCSEVDAVKEAVTKMTSQTQIHLRISNWIKTTIQKMQTMLLENDRSQMKPNEAFRQLNFKNSSTDKKNKNKAESSEGFLFQGVQHFGQHAVPLKVKKKKQPLVGKDRIPRTPSRDGESSQDGEEEQEQPYKSKSPQRKSALRRKSVTKRRMRKRGNTNFSQPTNSYDHAQNWDNLTESVNDRVPDSSHSMLLRSRLTTGGFLNQNTNSGLLPDIRNSNNSSQQMLPPLNNNYPPGGRRQSLDISHQGGYYGQPMVAGGVGGQGGFYGAQPVGGGPVEGMIPGAITADMSFMGGAVGVGPTGQLYGGQMNRNGQVILPNGQLLPVQPTNQAPHDVSYGEDQVKNFHQSLPVPHDQLPGSMTQSNAGGDSPIPNQDILVVPRNPSVENFDQKGGGFQVIIPPPPKPPTPPPKPRTPSPPIVVRPKTPPRMDAETILTKEERKIQLEEERLKRRQILVKPKITLTSIYTQHITMLLNGKLIVSDTKNNIAVYSAGNFVFERVIKLNSKGKSMQKNSVDKGVGMLCSQTDVEGYKIWIGGRNGHLWVFDAEMTQLLASTVIEEVKLKPDITTIAITKFPDCALIGAPRGIIYLVEMPDEQSDQLDIIVKKQILHIEGPLQGIAFGDITKIVYIENSQHQFMVGSTQGLACVKVNKEAARISAFNRNWCDNQNISQVLEIGDNLFLVGFRNSVGYCIIKKSTAEQKDELVRITAGVDPDNNWCSDLQLVPNFDINFAPYCIARNLEGLDIINVKTLKVTCFIKSESLTKGKEQMIVGKNSQNNKMIIVFAELHKFNTRICSMLTDLPK